MLHTHDTNTDSAAAKSAANDDGFQKYRVYYRAVCTNCGRIEKTGSTDTFLDPFFLPDDCAGCGEWRCKGNRFGFGSDWRTERVKLGLKRSRFVPLRPSTWFGMWVQIEPVEGTETAEGE